MWIRTVIPRPKMTHQDISAEIEDDTVRLKLEEVNEKLKFADAVMISKSDDWREFRLGYSHTYYDINKYGQELPSTAGPQLPRFFVSHWWGEPVKDFIMCIDRAQLGFRLNARDQDTRGDGFMSFP